MSVRQVDEWALHRRPVPAESRP